MQTSLVWKKGLFSDLYHIYSNGKQIGKLKDKSFTQTANGEFEGKAYRFRTTGFLTPHTEVIDLAEDKVIGEITYNTWMTKATISVNSKTINWKNDNAWHTQWSLSDTEGVHIKYAGSSVKGQIDSNVDDDLLILCGLFVTNYYWQMTVAVLVAVFVPVLATALN